MYDFGNRKFQVWDYWISHGQLLIRSPKRESIGCVKNIDVRFTGVKYLEIPCTEFELQIEQPTEEEKNNLTARLERNLYRGENVFVLVCNGTRHYIIAGPITTEENDLDIFESSLKREWSLK